MERYKEIERSIIKKYRKEIWSKFIKAIKDYELIKENDKVMVCISGGKDSFLLAKCIQELVRRGKVPFTDEYVCTPGSGGSGGTDTGEMATPDCLAILWRLWWADQRLLCVTRK